MYEAQMAREKNRKTKRRNSGDAIMDVMPTTHEPDGYDCPFCRQYRGKFDDLNAATDVVVEGECAFARISPRWWPNNPGHVLVVSNGHYENLYDLPAAVGHAVFDLTQRIARAMRMSYGCNGISTRQHNEPAGGQDVWHFHTHIFPRFDGDDLYRSHDDAGSVPIGERARFAAVLRDAME